MTFAITLKCYIWENGWMSNFDLFQIPDTNMIIPMACLHLWDQWFAWKVQQFATIWCLLLWLKMWIMSESLKVKHFLLAFSQRRWLISIMIDWIISSFIYFPSFPSCTIGWNSLALWYGTWLKLLRHYCILKHATALTPIEGCHVRSWDSHIFECNILQLFC